MSENEVCPANINEAGRRRRTWMGLVALVATLGAHSAFVRHLGALCVLAEFPTFFFGWLCLVQAADRTCVVLAARGTRETDDGKAPIDDAAIVAALKKRASMVYVKTALAATVSVATLYFLGP